MFKRLVFKFYELAYSVERFCIKKGIYTECDLYNIRFEYHTKQMRKKRNAKGTVIQETKETI